MGEQQTGIPLADGLSCTLDATREHPERFATIIGGAAPLSLNKVQALALFRILLYSLGQIAGNELQSDSLLQQIDLIQMLRLQYDRIEGAASKIDVDLEELADEDEDELEDEATE
jgi:hypothetical protein